MAKLNDIQIGSEKIEQIKMANKYPIEVVGANKYLSFQFIAALIDHGGLVDWSTFSAHERYMKVCEHYDVIPLNQISFSLFVVNNFNIEIINKKSCGKKFRVFRRFKMVQDGSGQTYKL
ncbi:hypothetical protein [Alkaliphilus sp. B6464]|uniref:hypothetical protein n=1 Tax=Alkaliphilus sp. B6464 TaxID=2731219 RepID=UPI001BA5B184|nr:hypothetical protein [Alkaliphilus sp. B6464]QUH18696.1 hypothetical protein HYG84_01415 [Alkaliphilus sp. B6464]